MSKIYIGIDNGTTGTIGIVGDDIESRLYIVPTKKEQNYQKTAKNISRLDYAKFLELFKDYDKNNITAILERPLNNPTRYNSTMTAMRCFEAELIVLEMSGIRFMFIDSKEWQKELLPKGISGSEDLKKASLDIGNRLFPQFKDVKHKDRDGILIAEYARRKNL